MKIFIILVFIILNVFTVFSQNSYPTPIEGDYIIKNFKFENNQILPQLNIHYTTVGKPLKDNTGKIINAILIMHGTTGNGHQFLSDMFAGHLFNNGQLLDANKYYIIMPDAIGHGKSSKPSDGLHMNFPKYSYVDMTRANYQLLATHLGITHMRLIMGTSMGGMQTWVWGYSYPQFMDALMPLASLPVEIAGRNRMLRKMAINLIEMDPQWKGGEYTSEPKVGLTGAISSLIFMVSSPLQWQKKASTRMEADSMLDQMEKRYYATLDANDMIYQLDASHDYNPLPHLSEIVAPLMAINSADDQVNPPELQIMEREIVHVKKGKFILLPITEKTSGHGTHSNPEVWGNYLKDFLLETNN